MLPMIMVEAVRASANNGWGVMLYAVMVSVVLPLSLYQEMTPTDYQLLLGISGLLYIPAFGEILPQWYAWRSASPSLSGTHSGLKRLCGARV
ncbi:MAG: hypothetical protein WCR98_07875 [Saccharofermentanales bacterium]|nr:hypothetical protein [Bacteroidales bacterium]